MRPKILIMLLSVLPLSARAGGDYAPVQISGFSGSNGHYQLTVTQQGKRLIYDDNCRTFSVLIEPRKQTWKDKFLPSFLTQTDHPEPHETEAAAQVLRTAAAQKRTIHFGYLGGGLFPDPQQKCLYHGTGIEQYDGYIMIRQDARERLYPYMDGYRKPR